MIRIQVEFPEEKARVLEALMDKAGIRTKKELLNNALSLLQWVINETEQGNKILSISDDNRKELVMPMLSYLADHARNTRYIASQQKAPCDSAQEVWLN